MKRHILAKLAVCCLALQLGGQEKTLAAAGTLKTEPQKAGYAFGMSLADSLKRDKITMDAAFLGKAAKAQLSGAATLMSAAEVSAVLKSLRASTAFLPPADKNFKTGQEKLGYAFGFDFAQRMKASGLGLADVDVDQVVQGVQDRLAGKPTLLTTNEMVAVFAGLQDKMEEKEIAQLKAQDPKFKADSERNAKAGTDFMAKNKTAPGVISLTNGLQYTVLTAGRGPIPKSTDSVKVNYRGTFLDGTQFDASPPDKPFPCNLAGGVIPGWIEVLKRMPVGSKWRVVIPPNLAYRGRGFPPAIPPSATLIFEMELVSIDPAK